MTTYISILRGINVSGRRIIKMDDLKKLFADLGFSDIRTYIQSGNVIFRAKKSDPEKLSQRIADAIAKKYSFAVPVIVKESEELKQIVADNTFANDTSKDPSFLHITFLSGIPSDENYLKIQKKSYSPDEFILLGNAVYLYCPGGYGNTKLNNTFLEKGLKITATTRNWKTTNELIRLAENTKNG